MAKINGKSQLQNSKNANELLCLLWLIDNEQ